MSSRVLSSHGSAYVLSLALAAACSGPLGDPAPSGADPASAIGKSSAGTSAALEGAARVEAAVVGRLELMARDSASGRRIAAAARYQDAQGEHAASVAAGGPAGAFSATAAGPVPVSVAAPGYRAAATDVEVRPGLGLPVTFWLDPEEPAAELRPEAVMAQLRDGHHLLHGHVTDVLAGRPVAGARVLARGAGLSAATDGRGYFTLSVPARRGDGERLPDVEDLEISAAGYKTYVIGHTAVHERGDTHFIVDLDRGAGVAGRDDTTTVELDPNGELERSPGAGVPAEAMPTSTPASPGEAHAVSSEAFTATTIPVPTNIKLGTSCSCTSCGAVSVYSRETYVKNGLNDEWIASWSAESLKAGAVAYRSYGSYYALIGRISSSYDICNNTCCQVMDTDTSINSDSAVTNTAGVVLSSDSRQASRSEYAAENNHIGACADGQTGDGSGWSCLSDSVCTGTAANGHGRGMCQWGSQRWSANQAKTYTWILDHYYNNNGFPSGSRNVYRKSGSTACLGAANDTTCNNFDPIGSGCSYDGSTPTGAKVAITNSVGSTLGWVELRWSAACGVNWARVTSNIGAASMTGTVQRDDGVSYTDSWSGTTVWSELVYSPVRASRACGTISGVTRCTAYY